MLNVGNSPFVIQLHIPVNRSIHHCVFMYVPYISIYGIIVTTKHL